jgi:hypothetical protein
VNLFQQPSGALEFMSQEPDVPEGLTYEPMDVSTLGPDAVGFGFRSSIPDGAASTYSVAFAEGVIQVSLTTLYENEEAPPDYTLNLAQQARTLVEAGLGSRPVSPSPQGNGAMPASPTGTPTGITVPTQAEVGTP